MRKLILTGLVAILTASAAQAATITYTLEYNDPSQGGAGKWGLYADVVGGGGMAAFNVQLKTGAGTDIGTGTVTLFAPQVVFNDSSGSATPNPEAEALGFLRSTTTVTGGKKMVGSQDTLDPGIVVYGLGQTAGTLSVAIPSGYDGVSVQTQTTYAAHLLVAKGTFTGTPTNTAADWFLGTPNANLFNNTVDFTNSVVTAALNAFNGGQSDVAELTLGTAVSPTNSYTGISGQALTVNHNTEGTGLWTAKTPINQTGTGNTATKGLINMTVPGAAPGNPIYVLLWLSGPGSLTDGSTLADGGKVIESGAFFNYLKGLYDTNLTAMVQYNSLGANNSLVYSYDLPSGAFGGFTSLDAIAVVPEPASLGLLALGALGLLTRRRR